MERLTERHAGVAVIKDKSKHKEAMEKLAKLEETENEPASLRKSIMQITLEVSEDICDNFCKYRDTADKEHLCDVIRYGGSCPLDRLN